MKKKILGLAVAVAVTLGSSFCGLNAYDCGIVHAQESDTGSFPYGVTWKVEGTTITFSGTDKAHIVGVEAAEVVKNHGVETLNFDSKITGIGMNAFKGCSTVKKVVIPNTITSISSAAFEKCSGLTQISIPNSVTTFGTFILQDCTSLVDVQLPNNMKEISNGFFSGCTSLKSVDIPETVTNIESQAFNECTSLETITFPAGLKNLGSSAFYHCEKLKSITIPSGMTEIGTQFTDSGITSLYIPAWVTKISVSAFAGCDQLETIKVDKANTYYADLDCNVIVQKSNNMLIQGCKSSSIPNSVQYIGKLAFYGMTGIEKMVIPSNVKVIDEKAFWDCTGLEEITFSEGLSTIASDAFHNCTSLKQIYIPKSVGSIHPAAFGGCSSLESIKVDKDNENFSDEGCNVIFSKSLKYVMQGCNKSVIPGDTKAIYDYAFAYLDKLETIEIPNSVTTIMYGAFKHCSGLKTIEIPDSVTDMSDCAFQDCKALTSVKLPNAIKLIRYSTFNGCTNLQSINIPQSVKRIGNYSFFGCAGLKELSIPKGVEEIEEQAFEYCVNLSEVEISDTVTEIGNLAFSRCENLQKITIPDGVETLGTNIFKGTNKVTIYCHDNTAALNYAKENGLKYEIVTGCFVHSYEEVWVKATLDQPGSYTNQCTVCGAIEDTYIIYNPGTIELSDTSFEYTGKAITPEVTIKDVKGQALALNEDYSVSYANNIHVGVATVTVIFQGKYSGSKELTFEIKASTNQTELAKPVIISIQNLVNGVQIEWDANVEATGYIIYRSTSGGAYKCIKTIAMNSTVKYLDTGAKSNGKSYSYKVVAYREANGATELSDESSVKTIYFISKPVIKKTLNITGKKLSVKWAKNKKASGYVIQCSTSKKFKKAKNIVVSNKGKKLISYTAKNLKKGKKYYVRIRSYKKVKGKKYYSSWSKVKKIIISK